MQGTAFAWENLAWALYYSGATALIAAALLASWSRGAWLGAAAGVPVVLVLRSRLAALLSGAALLLLLAGLLLGTLRPDFVPAPVAGRLQDIPAYFGLTDVLRQPLTDENFSVVERVAHWVAAQRMWALAPGWAWGRATMRRSTRRFGCRSGKMPWGTLTTSI